MAVSTESGPTIVALVCVVGLLIGALAFTAITADAATDQPRPDADNTVTRIEVSESGSARWTVQIRTRIDTAERASEYAAFQSRFRNDTAAYLAPFRRRNQGVVANAANTTGRNMRATNFTATTSIQEVPRRWGIVTYGFTWTNFAARENGTLVVGDVFQGGFFITGNDTLQISAPPDHEVTRVSPPPDSEDGETVIWRGREDFADGRPRAAFSRDAPADDGLFEIDLPGSEGDSSDGMSGPVVVVGVGIVSVLGLAAARRRRNGSLQDDATERRSVAQTDQETEETNGTAPDPGPETEAPPAGGAETPVRTDEERVQKLLEANDGRMRQAAIADAFDWSASKTSRVVGRMAEEGTVEKLRLGRENLVAIEEE